jgi:hypothetical protein
MDPGDRARSGPDPGWFQGMIPGANIYRPWKSSVKNCAGSHIGAGRPRIWQSSPLILGHVLCLTLCHHRGGA